MITKYDAVLALVPDVSFGVTAEGQIIWHEEPQQKPTEEAIQAKLEELQNAEPMRLLRQERNRRIKETDWRTTVDYPGTDQDAWRTYRQALRDLPSTAEPQLDENGNLTNVTWPTKPT